MYVELKRAFYAFDYDQVSLTGQLCWSKTKRICPGATEKSQQVITAELFRQRNLCDKWAILILIKS